MSTQTRPASSREGSSNQPAVAVVGCGYWGKNLVRNFAQIGSLVAVSDPDPDTAGKMAAENEVAELAFSEILSSEQVSGVVIAAPAAQHHTLVREALHAGKDVFVEKPLALTLAEAEELVDTAASNDRVLMVGHLLQYHPVFAKLKEMVGDGVLGRLQYIYSNRLNLGKVRREENILWSFAPHDLSMILSLIGDEPESVLATGANYLHQRIADVTTTHLAFPGGEHAHVFVSWLHPFKEQKLVVVGSDAMAVFDDREDWDNKLLVYPHRIDWRGGLPQPQKADAQPVPVPAQEPLRLECEHFLHCMAHRETPRTDGQEGLRVLRVLNAAEESMSSEATVKTARSASQCDNDKPPEAFVHETSIVDEPSDIGAGTKIWHFSHVLKGTSIGTNCSFGQNCVVGPDVSVGNNCKVQNNVSIYQGVTLEDDVFCGPSMVFTNVYNPRADVARMDELRPTLVRRGATIGANATIVCGVTLGEYCLVGAGAVVSRSVVPHAVVTGVPARRTGWVSHAGEILGEDLVCPRSNRRYEVVGDELKEITDGA